MVDEESNCSEFTDRWILVIILVDGFVHPHGLCEVSASLVSCLDRLQIHDCVPELLKVFYSWFSEFDLKQSMPELRRLQDESHFLEEPLLIWIQLAHQLIVFHSC